METLKNLWDNISQKITHTSMWDIVAVTCIFTALVITAILGFYYWSLGIAAVVATFLTWKKFRNQDENSSGTEARQSGNMGTVTGTAWAVVILALGTFIFVTMPYLLIKPLNEIAAIVTTQVTAAIWLMWLAFTGIRTIPKPTFWVVERFGQLWVVKDAGIRLFLLLGLVDKIKDRNTLALQRFKLYEEGEGGSEAEIDFADGASAPVRGDFWFRIIDPVKWTYAYGEGESGQRVQQIVDGFIRPRLQALTISEARTEQTAEGTHLSEQLKSDVGVREALEEIGVELDPNKPFILSDIIISQEIKDALKEKLVAEILADADEERSRGVRNAIGAILKDARGLRGNISYKDAVTIFTNRTSLSTLEKIATDGKGNINLNFVTPDMGGVTRTFEVGSNK